MAEVNWIIVFVLIISLVSVDKIITYFNIKAVEKNFPEIDKFSIEKNPLAKKFFRDHGLILGSIIYWIISIITFIVALALIKWTIQLLGIPNSLTIALWIMTILYVIVIGNNIVFLLKYNKLIP